MKKFASVLISAAFATAIAIGGIAAPASAATSTPPAHPDGGGNVTYYSIVHTGTTYNFTDYTHEIGRCYAPAGGITCTIATTTTATRTIGTALTMTTGWVASQLGISSSSGVSTTISCSRLMAAGQSLVAFPMGTYYQYKIAKTVAPLGGTTYSGPLQSFDPTPNAVTCGLG